jgi:hypothetical protein
MACFSVGTIEYLLVELVILAVIVGVVRILLPYILAQLGVAGDMVMRVINLILWGICVIAAIYLIFALLGCLGGGLFPFRH